MSRSSSTCAQLVEVGLDQGDGQAAQPLPGRRQHGGVAVQADHPAGRADPLGQQPGVAAAADRGIDEHLPGLRLEGGQHLGREHGDMP